MKKTFKAFFRAADEKLDAMSAHMGSADKRVIKRHDALDERMSEKFNKLFADLNKSFCHAGEMYTAYANNYLEMQRLFGHTSILPE